MIPIRDTWVTQIDVTNYCCRSCVQCTRLCHHMPPSKRYNMKLDYFAACVDSLARERPGSKLGIIGGEPTIHPQFRELAEIVRDKWTARGWWAGLWTVGGKWPARHPDAVAVFSWLAVNDKASAACLHQRLLVASRDVIPDLELRRRVQDACWVQRDWAPTMTPRGVYFCEVAAAICLALDGPDGWPLDAPWGSYGPADYEEQRWACERCGMCVPQPRDHVEGAVEYASQTWVGEIDGERLRRSYPLEPVSLRFDSWEQVLAAAERWYPGEYAPGRAKGGIL